jgi:hypothetical protein
MNEVPLYRGISDSETVVDIAIATIKAPNLKFKLASFRRGWVP